MIPYYSYSPEDVDSSATSGSSSYFQVERRDPSTAQISAHSYDSISPLGTSHANIPFDSIIYSHSAPTTPYQADVDPLRRHLLSPPLRSTPFPHPPHAYRADNVYDHTSSLIRFDQAPVASSNSVSGVRREEALCPPPPVPLPPRPPSASVRAEILNDEKDVAAERRLRGKRGKRESSTVQSEPGRATPALSTQSLPESRVSEEPSIEKADKSCKACRLRKVRCSRDWPKCVRCVEKTIECSYGDLIPISLLKTDKLQERIRALEAELAATLLPSTVDFPSFLAKIVEDALRGEPVSVTGDAIDIATDNLGNFRSILDEFRATHGFNPVCRGFLARSESLIDTFDRLAPIDQVAITLCLSAAVKAKKANEAFLGSGLVLHDQFHALEALVFRLYDQYGLAYEDASRESLELHLLGSLIFALDECSRGRSRAWLRNAIAMYRDLLDSAQDLFSQAQLMQEFGLSMLELDCSLSSAGQTSPMISSEDLLFYFSIFPRPTASSSLNAELEPLFSRARSHQESQSRGLDETIDVVHRWVVFVARWIAEQCSLRGMHRAITTAAMSNVFCQIAQIHSAIASLQNHLLQASTSPDGEDEQHRIHQLRFLSRLNYRVDESVYRCYGLVEHRLSKLATSSHDFNVNTLQSIEEKVLEGIKRATFYFRLYSISAQPHECQQLFNSLASFPGWIAFAVERSSTSPHDNRNQLGLDFRAHVSQTELDWIEHGLEGLARCEAANEKVLEEFRGQRNRKRGRLTENSSRVDRSMRRLDFRQAILRVSTEVAWI